MNTKNAVWLTEEEALEEFGELHMDLLREVESYGVRQNNETLLLEYRLEDLEWARDSFEGYVVQCADESGAFFVDADKFDEFDLARSRGENLEAYKIEKPDDADNDWALLYTGSRVVWYDSENCPYENGCCEMFSHIVGFYRW